MGEGGEIFILRMGTPIRGGYIPDKDIKIQVTGLRPGEKLYEELITQGEDILQTGHEDIMVLNTNGNLPLWHLQREIRSLVELARRADADGIKLALQRIVPEYTPELSSEVEKLRSLEGETRAETAKAEGERVRSLEGKKEEELSAESIEHSEREESHATAVAVKGYGGQEGAKTRR